MTADAAHELQEVLGDALSDARLVVLDLQDVDHIDPLGVLAVVRGNRTAQAEGRRLVIIGPPADVHVALQFEDAECSLIVIDTTVASQIDAHSLGGLEVDIRVLSSAGGLRFMLTCRGEIDAATAPRLRDAIAGVDLGDVVVDLSGTSFMDSAGLSTLLHAQRRLTREEHGLIVVCPAGPVRDVFALTGLLDTLNVVDDQTAAERILSR